MRNEEAVVYTAGNLETTNNNGTMLVDARIKLVGHEEPTIKITTRGQLEKYCRELIADCAYEEFHVICVNAQCQVLTEICIGTGGLSEVSCPPAKVAAAALLSNAHSVFFTHNHPGGTCSPSREDIVTTMTLKKALKMFEIGVLDHMIVASTGNCYSMMQHGDISYD